ncbi:outer membrane lipoprotein chaperone LolA [uncultured Thiodictyon sp.]|uniref:outer membrane lipoprotein chaperone LolA n=1 Tax=uncultured Thiodictyon sp. TaxID=1846217 RepID=UPI0025EA2246|nr:outer membrane lipoprotein chaperone LolA [uncultured Thiodictyon sp.]
MPQTHRGAAPSGRRRRPFTLLLVGLIGLGLGLDSAAADGRARLEAFLKGLTSLQSSFEQTTFNADRTRMTQGRGTLYLQRPGRFRWEYDTPNKQVIIADGKRVYLHDLDLDQVSHQSEEKALRGTPALLLANDAPIDRDFNTRPIASTDGRDWVELTPKAKDTDIVRIELGFGSTGLESMIMEDSFGQETRLNFGQTKRNPILDLGLFKMDEKTGGDFLSFD